MQNLKTIICLANSWKGHGRCIAGLEIDPSSRKIGGWIRPVTTHVGGEFHGEERLEGGGDPRLLEMIEIPLDGHVPSLYQTENHAIAPNVEWRRVGRLRYDELRSATDCPSGLLWVNGHSTRKGHNDKIPERDFEDLGRSLHLVAPRNLRLKLREDRGDDGRPRAEIRARFALDRYEYALKVTDPCVYKAMQKRREPEVQLEDCLLCISLSEPFHGHSFKLVAGLITPKLGAS